MLLHLKTHRQSIGRPAPVTNPLEDPACINSRKFYQRSNSCIDASWKDDVMVGSLATHRHNGPDPGKLHAGAQLGPAMQIARLPQSAADLGRKQEVEVAAAPLQQACGGRGRCVRGVCDCGSGRQGYNCSDGPRLGEPHTPTPADNGFLYVHSPPSTLGLQHMRRFQHHGGYNADYFLLARLMENTRVRTRDASQAALFYVPTWASDQHGNAAYRKNVGVQEALVRWLERAGFGEHWRANCSRYIFQYTGDKCLLPREPVYVAYWGLNVPWSHMSTPHTYVPAATAGRAPTP
eukprot:3730374-Prymnesium_polylepis.1